jgi:phosphatidate cytidylyltransferase
MLGARLATAAVAIPILLAIIFKGSPSALAILIFVLGSIALAEYLAMAFLTRPRDFWQGVGLGVGVLAVACLSTKPGLPLTAAFAAAVAALLILVVVRPVDLQQGLRDCSITWLGITYVVMLVHFVWLRYLPDGSFWVTFVVANGMASDTGAYFAGRAFGRRKLLPRVSPGKTVEGAIGNLVAAGAVGTAAKLLFFPDRSVLELVLLAVLLAAVGQLGDLSESVIKRAFGSKESGGIFPGHGGVLDRIDSLLFPVAILYYYLSLA